VSNEYTDKQAVLTEHFTPRGARSQMVSRGAATTTLYASAVFSPLVALAFIGQRPEIGNAFNAFALLALATLHGLGVLTFVRLVQSATEDLAYGRAINRIRGDDRKLARDRASLFMRSAHDDIPGVLAGGPQQRRRRGRHGTGSRGAECRFIRLRGRRRGRARNPLDRAARPPSRNWRLADAAQSEPPPPRQPRRGQRTERRHN
jgi:hypothetical protein